MKNKKGMNWMGWIGLLLVIMIASLALWYAVSYTESPTSPFNVCKDQCKLHNLTFHYYNSGVYTNDACLCKDKEGLIKTIYIQ